MTITYTESVEETLRYSAKKWDKTSGVDEVIELLNDKSSFRTFGEGLLHYINLKNPNIDIEDATKFLLQMYERHGIESSVTPTTGTLNNWFAKGMRPKKGETSRKFIFAFAFANELTPEDTADLFHKVYFDRAFNYRNEEEIVFYYCLNKKKTWEDAKKIITCCNSQYGNKNDETCMTVDIYHDLQKMDDDKELIEYITTHGHNLEQDNVKAKEVFSELLSEAKTLAKEEFDNSDHKDYYYNKWKNKGLFINTCG